MKRFLLLAWMLVMAVPSLANAGNVLPFRGMYEILQPTFPDSPGRHFLLIDVDTVERIWTTYRGPTLPDDIAHLRNERAAYAVARLGDHDSVFLSLEAGVLTTPNYLSIMGVGNNQLELQRNPNGTFTAAVQDGAGIVKLQLAAPAPLL